MPIVRVAVTDGDPVELEARYRKVNDRLQREGPFPPDGLKVHTAMKTPTGFRVANIWESTEHADKAWERVAKLLREEGADTDSMTFEEYEVVNLVIA